MPLPRHPFKPILDHIKNEYKNVSIKQIVTGVQRVQINDWEESL